MVFTYRRMSGSVQQMNETAWLSHRATLIFILIIDHAQNEMYNNLSYFKERIQWRIVIE